MASKIDSVMSTSIALDTLKASKGINTLAQAVRASTNAWKAQEAQAKSAGDYLKASESRYKGLSDAIEIQQKKIETIKDKMKDLDQTTQSGAKQWVKYQSDLQNASKQLQSMEAQQKRAGENLRREKSGINDLSAAMKRRNALSEAFVARLESEGKHEQALKEKRENARKSINDTVSALKKEEYLLKSMERSGGSETAINKQRIAIEKLKTSLNESRKSVSKYDEQLERLNPSPINRIKERFSGLNREGRKTHSIFKSVFAANIVSNAFTNSIGAISLKLHEAWDSAMEYAKAQQTMNASWLTLTGNAKEGKKMVNMTNEMAASFANSTDMVNDLNQKFYAISNSSKTTRDLTKDVLTLQDAFGQSDDAVKNFSTQWSQMMANGKVSAQDMMSFVNVFPKIRTELLKTEQKITGNSKLSMKQMNDMMSAGKISSDTMKKVLDNMQKEYSGATENFGKTFDGMKRTITARVPALLNAFTGPFLNAKNPLMGAVSKWVSDKNTEKEFAKLGGVASKGFSTVSKAFAKALDFKPTNNTGEKIVKGMSSGITSLSKTIASHANQIVGFFKGLWNSVKIIGSIGAGFFKGLASALNSVATPLAKMTGHNKKIRGLSDSLGELSKHKSGLQTLGKVLAGVFITSKALGFASAITKVGEAMGLLKKSYTPLQLLGKGLNLVKDGFVKLTIAMMGNPFAAIAVAITAIGVGLFELYKHNKKFRDMVNGWGKAISKFTSGALKSMGKFFSDFGKSWNKFWGGIGSGIGKAWEGASKKASSGASSIRKAFSKKIGDISDWFGDVGKGISKWWKGFSKAFEKGFNAFVKKVKGFFKGLGKVLVYAIAFPVGLAMIIFGPIVKTMNKGIQIIAKPIKKMGKAVSQAFMAIWEPISKYAKKTLSAIGEIIRRSINGWVKIFKTVGKALSKAWQAVWKPISKFLSKTLSAMGKLWKEFTNRLSKVWNSFSKAFKKNWNKFWNAIHDFFNWIFKKIAKTFNDWTKSLKKVWNGISKWFSKVWHGFWGNISDVFSGTTKAMHKTWTGWTNAISKSLNSFKKFFGNVWHDISKATTGVFSSMWDEMKRLAASGINAIFGVINTGVSGINNVIHLFGGKKETIKPLSKVKFATGTGSLQSTSFRRAITQITPAIVNDEPGAKNPELIFRKATGNVEYLKEKNAQTVLFPGDEVANATDSATLAPMLGLTKFAKGGIGDFFGGLWNGVTGFVSNVGKKLKDLWTAGTKIIAHPIKALEGLMPFSNKGAKGFFPTMVKGGYNFVKNQATDWWKTLWSMADLNGGGAFGGSWAHTPSTKMMHTDSFGSPRSGGVHDGNDYSGPIGTLIRAVHGGKVVRAGGPPSGWGAIGYNIVTKDNDGVYVIYQEFGHAGDAKVSQGDVVKTGDPIAKLGRSGLGTGPHVHIGVSKNYPFNNNGMSTKGWYDLMKMKGSSSGKGSDVKANSSLQKLIKSQVGSGFWKMIAKLSSMFGDSGDAGGGANPGGAGVKRWKPYVIKALKALGLSTSASMVARVLRQINTESGGNPNAIGGTDGLSDGRAMGLMQVKPGTFRAYGRKGGKWDNGYDSIYAGLNYAKHRYGPSLSFLGQGHGYANGGIANTPSIFGEAGPEMAIPLSVTRSDRAKQLLGETAIRLAKTDPEKLAESQPNDASRVSDKKLYDRIDAMSNMMAKMIMLLKEQITTTKQTAFDKRHLYRTESLDQIISDYQSL
ncbi:tape measure protein [Pediococcus acidilactici]|uniref:tape measure protein n=1 Tax=Pediococcus acidilactici TaxID=1254 RepID=UPI000FE42EEE|nr:tape measure protein [Pediococcus acidilactici]KAF0373149.1 peptidoglycan DD-metalloendopeptidase family protein [Pediococcus acidilactici]KAF0383659.1 peptidoglycan DD-metalloendopeptidase family protein [Pediococcus acidilactici]KAF0457645.1 peptidoglycan DD-metalloendopeptidase family protein [Pediococcus acidilactici]KAF0476921.1 peptidoglycan DD-metalloendopeptidase family protein [Pediococcus acidilactici]KAF0537447.1 peptidoglycan DD-metalloendopeptidase family protein [Pediococcus a